MYFSYASVFTIHREFAGAVELPELRLRLWASTADGSDPQGEAPVSVDLDGITSTQGSMLLPHSATSSSSADSAANTAIVSSAECAELMLAAAAARRSLIESLGDLNDDIAMAYLEHADATASAAPPLPAGPFPLSSADSAAFTAAIKEHAMLAVVPAAEIHAAVRAATLSSGVVPVFAGSSLRNRGVQSVMDAVVRYLPSPLDVPALTVVPVEGADGHGRKGRGARASKQQQQQQQQQQQPSATDCAAVATIALPPSSAGPLCALAFKVTHDPQRGPIVFVRVFSGTLRNKESVVNVRASVEAARAKVAEAEQIAAAAAAATAGNSKPSAAAAAAAASTSGGKLGELVLVKERPTRLLEIEADESNDLSEVRAGNICAIVGLKNTKTGDTLVGLTQPGANKPFLVELPGIKVPEPVFFCSVEPATAAGQKDLDRALSILALDDPSLRVEADAETGQTVMKGMGELHLEVVKHRLEQEFKLDVWVGKMLISYRETVADASEYEHTHAITSSAGVPTGASVRIALALVPQLDLADEARCGTSGSEPVAVDCTDYAHPAGAVVPAEETANGVEETVLALDEALLTVADDGVLRAAARGPALGAPLTAMGVKLLSVRLCGAPGAAPTAALAAQAGGLTVGQLTAAVSRAVTEAVRAAGSTVLEPVMRTEVSCGEDQVRQLLDNMNSNWLDFNLSLESTTKQHRNKHLTCHCN